MIRSLGSMGLLLRPVILLMPLLAAAQGGESGELVEAGQRFRTILAKGWKRWMQEYRETGLVSLDETGAGRMNRRVALKREAFAGKRNHTIAIQTGISAGQSATNRGGALKGSLVGTGNLFFVATKTRSDSGELRPLGVLKSEKQVIDIAEPVCAAAQRKFYFLGNRKCIQYLADGLVQQCVGNGE